jgi:hypothetical protein
MEFSPRGFQRNSAPRPATNTTSVVGGDTPGGPGPDKQSPLQRGAEKLKDNKIFSLLTSVLFVSLVVLLVATIFGISQGAKESRIIDKDNYQTVVMADGQAYFGKISSINKDYIILRDVFYLQGQQLNGSTPSTAAQSAARLVKLGCEIHGPQDQMLIYRNQVTYWENLKKDGRVTKAIEQFKNDNPDGQDCDKQTTQPPAGNNAPNANGQPAPTQPNSPATPGAQNPGGSDSADETDAGADTNTDSTQ